VPWVASEAVVTPRDFLTVAVTPALSLLPERMESVAARAMMVAIALQESDLRHRRQINGPAVSYFQFERAGIYGVLTHPASASFAREVCYRLDYPTSVEELYRVMDHADVLAAAFARLLLWTIPERLPLAVETPMAWKQYTTQSWNPGKPHPARWNERWARAWLEVLA
jgi:hypothetical protein